MPPLSWVEIHGAITHIPVAFLLAVPVFEIGALVLRKPEWRLVSFWLLVGAVGLAVPALLTGWITGNDLKFTGTATPPPPLFVRHRLAAFTTSGLAVLLLWWRVRAGDQLPHKAHLLSVALALVTAGAVGLTGYLGGRMVFGETGEESLQRSNSIAVAPGFPPKVATAKTTTKMPAIEPQAIEPQLVAAGEKLFGELPCLSCHRMNGKGGKAGPELTHEAERHADISWHMEHLKDPQKMRPGSDMPPFDNLPAKDLKALASYLATRK